jgi:hypothetical protein
MIHGMASIVVPPEHAAAARVTPLALHRLIEMG